MSGDRIAATATERASLGSFLFTGREQLLCEQTTQSGGALDRPDPFGPRRRPRPKVLDLCSGGPDGAVTLIGADVVRRFGKQIDYLDAIPTRS